MNDDPCATAEDGDWPNLFGPTNSQQETTDEDLVALRRGPIRQRVQCRRCLLLVLGAGSLSLRLSSYPFFGVLQVLRCLPLLCGRVSAGTQHTMETTVPVTELEDRNGARVVKVKLRTVGGGRRQPT
ncbi:hypothetical protein AAG570_007188 [Ranatra chinensis]|uniref:Uncharacterized protein n=1 Tax=Ranatra chinensis TaxID=642074 RepID=A0ABD0XV46_9HEMI